MAMRKMAPGNVLVLCLIVVLMISSCHGFRHWSTRVGVKIRSSRQIGSHHFMAAGDESISTRGRAASLMIAVNFLLGSGAGLPIPRALATEGLTTLDGNDEARLLFARARQTESDGDFVAAQEFYQQVVQGEPEFIYGWANLANVLVQRGNLDQGLLCYKKALSLRPPAGEQLSTILLNTASTEMALGKIEAAVRDLDLAEKVGGPGDLVKINKAVILTQAGKWKEGCVDFEKVFKTSEKDALPWWLRYSMALLETNRGPEAVAYMQRVLQRYPYEAECKAFATALYSSLGSPQEASRYWKQMSEAEHSLYRDPAFLADKVKWGPVAKKSLNTYIDGTAK